MAPSHSRLRRALFGLGALVLLLGIGAAGGLWWLGTDAGLQFAVARLQPLLAAGGNQLSLDGATGSLYRGVAIDRFEWQGGGIHASGTKLVARWSLPALLRRQVLIPELVADTISVRLPPPEPDPAPREAITMPGAFALPITVELQRLAIGELRLVAGDASASDPGSSSTGDILIRQIDAQLSYRDGTFSLTRLGALTPYARVSDANLALGDSPPHPIRLDLGGQGEFQGIAFDLKLTAGGDLERLDASANGTAAGATVNVDARLAPLAVMPLSSAQAKLAGVDLRGFMPAAPPPAAPLPPGPPPPARPATSSVPRTLVDAQLNLAHDPAGNAWSGAISLSNAASGALSDGKLPLIELHTKVALMDLQDPSARRLQLRDLQLTLPAGAPGSAKAGRIAGSVDVFPGRSWRIVGATLPEVRAMLTFDTIDAAQFAAQLPATALGGRLTLNRNEFALNLSQSAERVRALMPQALAEAAGAAEIALRGRIGDRAVRLDEARIHLGQSRLTAAGEAGLSPPYRLALKGDALRIEPGQWLTRDTAIDKRWRNGRISGHWSVEGTVSPGLDAWLTLKLADSTLAGKPLAADLRTQLVLADDWTPVRISKAAVDIRLGENRVKANGALGGPSDKLALDVSMLEPELLDPGLRGRLTLQGELAGSFQALQARASLQGERLRLARPDGEIRIGSLRVVATGPAAATVPPQAPLDVAIMLRSVQAAGRTLDSIDLKADGTLQGHRFNLSAAGEGQSLKLNGNGNATLAGPPSWRARLDAASLAGTVPMRLTAPADIRLDAGSFRLEGFDVAVAGGKASLNRLAVDWSTGPTFDVRGAARELPITRLLALAGADPGLDAIRALRLDADWNLAGSGADDLSGSASIGLHEDSASGRQDDAGGKQDDKTSAAAAAASLGLQGDNGARLVLKKGQLEGSFDLALPSLAFTRPFTAPDLVIDGRLRLAGSVAGTVSQPLWNATLTGRELSLLQRAVGWRLTDGVLSARLQGREIQVESLKLAAGEGSVELRGRANLLDAPRPSPATAKPGAARSGNARSGADGGVPPSTLPMDGRFQVTASRFNVPLGPGQRVALSGETEIISDASGLKLRGKLRVDNGIIEIQGSSAPALPADVKLIDGRKDAASGDRKSDAAASTLRILTDLAVDLGDRLRVTGNGIAARLAGNLRVLGTLPNEPRLTGAINIVDGSYKAYGQNLRIEKGVIRFNGPLDNPGIELVAKRPFLPVEVGVAIGGTALNPSVTLVSTPDMSETDKLSWLVLGADPKEAPSAAQSLALRQAARSLLAKDDGRYTPGVAERLGLDVFNFGYGSDTGPAQGVTERMNPTGLPGSQSASATAAQQEVVTLGKRLGSRLFVSYEQGVRGIWNLLRIQYTLTRRLSLRAQSGSDNAVDLLYSYTFD